MGKNITIDEMKQIEVDIMSKIDEVCREHNLTYSLSDGSLLGAVRHSGFIPWDDDIDIIMPRPDYEKFKEILTEQPIECIKYMSCDTQDDFYYPYAKVVDLRTSIKEKDALEIKNYGVFIDIFPIDGVSENKLLRQIQIFEIMVLRNFIQIAFHEKEISNSKIKLLIKNVLAVFIKIFGVRYWVLLADKNIKKNSYEHSKYVALLCNDKPVIYEKQFFADTQLINFENRNFSAISNYDKYLSDLFGDYMKLPPEDKRVSNHAFDRLEWKERS